MAKTQTHVLRILILVVVLLLAALIWNAYTPVEVEEVVDEQTLDGGGTDEHGCLGPAGFSWDEEISACIRTWELEEEEARSAAAVAVDRLGESVGLTVLEVQALECESECYVVKLEVGEEHPKERKHLTITDGEVTDVTLTPAECEKLGGEPLNTLDGAECAEDEENVGDVTGFISPNVCCVAPETEEVEEGVEDETEETEE